MLVVHVAPNLDRTTHSLTGVLPTGETVTVVRPDSVSTWAVARGAFGARSVSQGDAGTSAGTAYGPATSRSFRPSRFRSRASMLKCRLPVAPESARVRRICSSTSDAGQFAPRLMTRLV